MKHNIKVITNYPVALSSRDHLYPHGTKNDNSCNPRFNQKLTTKPSPISILDFGCAGGAMVKSFLQQGDLAIGLEGSDYCLTKGRAEWGSIQDYLFTADITKPFQVLIDEQAMKFDVITAWEFFEHIKESNLQQVFENINNHLLPNGLVIGSINTNEEFHHRTAKPQTWWLNYISRHTNLELNCELLSKFELKDFVRTGMTSFHIICTTIKND